MTFLENIWSVVNSCYSDKSSSMDSISNLVYSSILSGINTINNTLASNFTATNSDLDYAAHTEFNSTELNKSTINLSCISELQVYNFFNSL